jgi:hypothetical protein
VADDSVADGFAAGAVRSAGIGQAAFPLDDERASAGVYVKQRPVGPCVHICRPDRDP